MEYVKNKAHKTVLVLDRGPKFASFAEMEFEITYKDGAKTKKCGLTPKTLWNASLDCAVEFHRVVSDVYPSGTNLMRYIISEAVAQPVLSRWHNVALHQEEFIQAMYNLGCLDANPETEESTCSILNAVSVAVDAFSEWTPHQRRAHSAYPKDVLLKSFDTRAMVKSNREFDAFHGLNGDFYAFENNCTLVIITSFDEPKSDFKKLVKSVKQYVTDKNRVVDDMKDPNIMTIDGMQVFILNISVASEDIVEPVIPLKAIVDDISFKCFTIKGPMMRSYVHRILLEAYDISSTIVKGIPMKEEAQPERSLDYDVEIFHPSYVHDELKRLGLLASDSPILKPMAMGGYKSVELKWCNPVQKLRKDSFPIRESFCYTTPADLLSRPTLCVIAFLKKGKSIWLELPTTGDVIAPNMGTKVITHVLCFDVVRQGISIHKLSIGGRLGVDEHFLSLVASTNELNLGEELGDAGLKILTPRFLDTLEEPGKVEILSRERKLSHGEPDPYLCSFPSDSNISTEKEVFGSRDRILTDINKWFIDVKNSVFIGEDGAAAYAARFPNLRKLITSNTTHYAAVETEIRKMLEYFCDLANDPVNGRYEFGLALTILYTILVELKGRKPALYMHYVNSIHRTMKILVDHVNATFNVITRKRKTSEELQLERRPPTPPPLFGRIPGTPFFEMYKVKENGAYNINPAEDRDTDKQRQEIEKGILELGEVKS